MSQVTLPLPSLGPAGATAAIDVVRLALTYLNGGTPPDSTHPLLAGRPLPAGQGIPGQGAAAPGAALPGPVQPAASGPTPVQHGTIAAKGGAQNGADTPLRTPSSPSEALGTPERAAQSDGRSMERGVYVAGRSDHAALVMRSHGAIAGLLRADAVLQIADGVLRKIDDRLARMQDLVRRATAGPSAARAREALDLPFQKLKQEVIGLVPAAAAGSVAATVPADIPGRGVRLTSAGDSVRLAMDINSPAVSLQRKIPAIVRALAQTGLSTQSGIAQAETVLAVVRSNGGEVQHLIAGQRETIGSLLSQELSRRIGISDSPVDRAASALHSSAGLSSAVASALVVPPMPVSAGQGAAMALADGEPPLIGGDGKSVRQVPAESLALLVGQPNRAGIAALLSPSAGSLDEPAAVGLQSPMPVADRPLPMPPPLSGMAAELLFGLVPGWRARSRDGLAQPKRLSGPRRKRRPGRKANNPYV